MKHTTAALSLFIAASAPLMGAVTYTGTDSAIIIGPVTDWIVMSGDASVTLRAGGLVTGVDPDPNGDASILATEQSILAIEGGFVDQDVVMIDDTSLTVSDGILNDDLVVADDADLLFTGGLVADDLEVYGFAHATVTGGSFGEDVNAYGPGVTVDISGGSFSAGGPGLISAGDGAKITLRGTSFQVNGGASTAGIIGATFGTLTGTLADGTSISMGFDQDPDDASTAGTIELILVPEPSTTALLGLAGAALIFRRRK